MIQVSKYYDLEIFQGISKDILNRIFEASEINKYKEGSIIFRDKEEVSNVFIVLSGYVSLYKINENGQKKVIFILGKGAIVNEVIVGDLTSSINCKVFEECELLKINREYLITLMKEDFELTKNIMESLSKKIRRMYRQLKNTPTSIKIEKRLAAKLYKLGLDYGVESSKGIYIDIELTITYMSYLLGSPRETVSRAMKKLQSDGLIEFKDKRVFIHDKNKLSTFFKTS